MQLRDVQVTKRPDGMSCVSFRGQGGESVEVCLAEAEGDPVDRARAVMIQIAAFDLGRASPPDEEDSPHVAEQPSAQPPNGPAGDVWGRPGVKAPSEDRD